MLGCERDDVIAMGEGRDIRGEYQAAIGHARERLDCVFDVGGGFDVTGHHFDREGRRNRLRSSQKVIESSRLAVPYERNARDARRDLLEHRQPFTNDGCFKVQHAGEIAARSGQARDKA